MTLLPIFLLLTTAAAQLQYGQAPSYLPAAQSTVVTFMSEIYTIPLFDPSLAPTFGASLTTIYRPTDLTLTTAPTSSPTSIPSAPASSRTKACSQGKSTATPSATGSATGSMSAPPAPESVEQIGNAAARGYGSLAMIGAVGWVVVVAGVVGMM